MAENHSKFKLKRKKTFAEDHQLDISSRGTLNRSHVSSSDIKSEPRRSVAPAAVWWNREQLSAAESLWALTLKSALPHLENQLCDSVPDLPRPSTARSTAVNLDEQRWCDLSEEVAPFPEPCPPSPRNFSSPGPLRLSCSQEDLSVETKPVTVPPDRQLASHSRQSHIGKTTPLQVRSKKPQPSLHSWEAASSSAGPSNVGRVEERKGGEQAKETEQLNRQLLTNQLKGSDRQVSLQKKDENEEEVVEDKEEEMQRSVRGDGDAAGGVQLQSCPMCLLVFPAGFTQMDCDGHLAQCLSEVNVDVTW